MHRALRNKMESSPHDLQHKRAKKACTECRQQKSRCDASIRQPCSRCAKFKVNCVISDPFRREHKRQKLSELQKEAQELRRRLQSSQSSSSTAHSSPKKSHSPTSTMDGENIYAVDGLSLLPRLNSTSALAPSPYVAELTDSRTLNNVTVTGSEIDDLFLLYFQNYHGFLPILDSRISPNVYYRQSPFLFWAVIGVSSRGYKDNPTLLSSISRSITEMGLTSVTSTSSAWHTLHGLLLLLTWPFPKENDKLDVAFPISGILLHIAMQHGLHLPIATQEFYKWNTPALSEKEIDCRFRLWAYCVLVYQRSCAIKGQPPRSLRSFEQDITQRPVLFKSLPDLLVIEVKCQEVITRCSIAMLEFGVKSMGLEKERIFDILIRAFEDDALNLCAQASTEDEKLCAAICRMSIQMFHFFKSVTTFGNNALPKVLETACSVIDMITALPKRGVELKASPVHIHFGLLLASIALLRILKGPDFRALDVMRAKTSFFSSINLAKQMSAANNDTCGKGAVVLSQLWTSSRAFRKPDGGEYVGLRIRSRLSLSPVIDALWWWRDEFNPPSRNIMPLLATSGAPANSSNGSFLYSGQDASLYDDEFLADFEWALSDEIFYANNETTGTSNMSAF